MRTIANPTTPGLAMIIPALWATQCEYWALLSSSHPWRRTRPTGI